MIEKEVKSVPIINQKKCSGCNKCINACNQNVFILKDMNEDKNQSGFFRRRRFKAVVQNADDCTNCGLCSLVCRHKAILFT